MAAFKTETHWTFNSSKVKRIVGDEFWSMINLDYKFILDEVKKMIKEIEEGYYKLRLSKT